MHMYVLLVDTERLTRQGDRFRARLSLSGIGTDAVNKFNYSRYGYCKKYGDAIQTTQPLDTSGFEAIGRLAHRHYDIPVKVVYNREVVWPPR